MPNIWPLSQIIKQDTNKNNDSQWLICILPTDNNKDNWPIYPATILYIYQFLFSSIT